MTQLNIDAVAKQLAEAERYVSQCAEILNKQRQLVADLERDDADTHFAKELLKKFEVAQASYIAHRDYLRKHLGAK